MKNNSITGWKIIAIIGCFCGIIYFWLVVLNIFRAEIFSAKSENSLNKQEFSLALEYANRATRLNPNEPAYLRRRAKILLLFPLAGQKEKDLARKDIQKAILLNPHNLATLRNSIPLMYQLSPQTFYRKLYNTYPSDAGILVSLAYYQRKLRLEEDLQKTLSQIKKLRPDLLEWHPYLIN